MKIKMIVYGTLRKGMRLHDYMKNAKFLGTGKVKNFQIFVGYGIPYALEKPGEEITAELYEFSLPAHKIDLKTIHRIEAGYSPELQKITLENGNEHEGILFVWRQKKDWLPKVLIKSGDFTKCAI